VAVTGWLIDKSALVCLQESADAVIIAATAELAGLTVLHLDKDFEIIAGITGQPLERLVLGTQAGPAVPADRHCLGQVAS
jgi:hypothetical protein